MPYLDKFEGRVLEVGIGYGTVAQYLNNKCSSYIGLDIAQKTIDILYYRGVLGIWGSVLEMNVYFPHSYFDGVVSIGCLHHTGNVPLALSQIHRVLKPGGRALIMLYNDEAEKLAVDINSKGERAPHIEYTNVSQLPELFKAFTSWRYDIQNGKNKDIYIEAIK